ncbi:MAG: type II toxin-antitoxin system RelE/ParE family toxin [Alphaproteobacteria bacterium]|nr:type II toxin-antitoxin system RelE/ParE family toxin [Alphaproteobacteria bacterium]
MIKTFAHRGLRALFEKGDRRRLQPEHIEKIENILAVLSAASEVTDMDLPGFRLHALRGDRQGMWAVTVRANWRITFRFEADGAFDVDYVDYH